MRTRPTLQSWCSNVVRCSSLVSIDGVGIVAGSLGGIRVGSGSNVGVGVGVGAGVANVNVWERARVPGRV